MVTKIKDLYHNMSFFGPIMMRHFSKLINRYHVRKTPKNNWKPKLVNTQYEADETGTSMTCHRKIWVLPKKTKGVLKNPRLD